MNKSIGILVTIAWLVLSMSVNAASLQKAAMFKEHGLTAQAKHECIDIIFSNDPEDKKSEAYYLLGSIAFEERRVSVALNSWTTLVEKYPNSRKAKLVKDKISELAEVVADSFNESIKNPVAQSYINHGDFWSNEKSKQYRIDTSLLPKMETAIKWYDKVLAEFPNTPAAKRAYESKLRTLLGWKERGENGLTHGLRKSMFIYMPRFVETLNALERDFPDSGSIQAFRYQIAQAYLLQKNWDKGKIWLEKIIEKAGDRDGFYKDLAIRRLKKLKN